MVRLILDVTVLLISVGMAHFVVLVFVVYQTPSEVPSVFELPSVAVVP